MKRLLIGICAAVLIVIGTASESDITNAQSANNFSISSFDADYYINKDNENRSTLKIVERITAVFPELDQNHGIERAIPQKYDGHSTSLKIISVKDKNEKGLNYSQTTSNGNLVLRIGDADTYVHGSTTYVITYTQRDVTRFFSDTNDDEFYWDVNGTGWQQDMNQVSARVHVSTSLAQSLNQKSSCYEGVAGSTKQCALDKTDQSDDTLFTAQIPYLNPRENVTVAIGFHPHTFTGYQPSLGEKILAVLAIVWIILQGISLVVAIVILTWMFIRRHRIMNRVKGRGTIVAEYLPPTDSSVLVSAEILGSSRADMTAQIIDLAVRHYLKIYQIKDKTLFKPAEYELEIVKDTNGLYTEEIHLLSDLFGGNLTIGSRFAMKKLQTNYTMGQKLRTSRKVVREDVRGKYGLFERVEKEAREFKLVGIIMIMIGIVTLSPLIIITALIAFGIAYSLWPLSEKGVMLRDYLAGLKLYITVAEEDRIKMLQSPEGTEKVGAALGENDAVTLVKLYERVLPYAVLFGVEKEWTKQLGAYYEQVNSQPDWYKGNSAFNAVVFSSALSSFSSQSSAYSASSSSTSGGSSGGGSSGGGGGGGGGGGW